MQAVIMAGGKGERMRDASGGWPKPLVALAGRPILAWTLEGLARRGFRQVFLCVGPDPRPFRAALGELAGNSPEIILVTEEAPRGTIGALGLCALDPRSSCLVMNGDVLTTLDFAAFLQHHESSGDDWSIGAHDADWPTRFGEVVADADGGLLTYNEKPWVRHRFSSGIHAISPRVTDWLRVAPAIPPLPELLATLRGEGLRVRVVPHEARWLDINDPDDLRIAERELTPPLLDAIAGRAPEPARDGHLRFGERGWRL